MCGLVGVVNLDGSPVAPELVERMSEPLAHRGADADGHYCDGAVGLGHRRLAILDLSPAGQQPMAAPGHANVLVYNGEVYNFRELRAELEAKGIRVPLPAPTPRSCCTPCRVGSERRRALQRHVRLRALRPRAPRGAAWRATATASSRSTTRSSATPSCSPPRSRRSCAIPASGSTSTPRRWSSTSPSRTSSPTARCSPACACCRRGRRCACRSTRDAAPRRALLGLRVRRAREPRSIAATTSRSSTGCSPRPSSRQLVSDVPVGSYLSGGMDTGAITAVASQLRSPLTTFTVGFDLSSASGLELGFDERAKAERLSYLCQTEHYEMVLKAGDMERSMPDVIWHLEEPRVGQSYPNFYAAKLAGQLRARWCSPVPAATSCSPAIHGATTGPSSTTTSTLRRQVLRLLAAADARERRRACVRPAGRRRVVLRRAGIFRGVFPSHAPDLTRPEDYINHSLYFEAKTFLHGLLVVEDKLSMAHSLETRLPFLDNDLVDFAMRVPVHLKLGNLGEVVRLNENEPGPKTRQYFQRTRDGKLLLREAMGRHVPADVAAGHKQGFSGPDSSWFRGESIDYVRKTLLGDSRAYEYLDRDVVYELVDDHLSGRENRRLLIWSLLCFDQWCECFL